MNNDDLFALPSKQLAKRLLKEYNPDQPRDEKGRWTAGGIARTAALSGAALLFAAGMGVPGARQLIPGARRAVLGGRYRLAREASSSAAIGRRIQQTSAEELRRQMAAARLPTGSRHSKLPTSMARQQLQWPLSTAGSRRAARLAWERRFV